MAATRDDIRRWLTSEEAKDCSHMIVLSDTFDFNDYPVYVKKGEDVKEVIAAQTDRLMEVYSFNVDLELQLAEYRAFHYE